MPRQPQPVKNSTDHFVVGKCFTTSQGIYLIGCGGTGCGGNGSNRPIFFVHPFPPDLPSADNRHKTKSSDKLRQRRNIAISTFGINERRTQYRPTNVPLSTECGDFSLCLSEFLQRLSLRDDFTVNFCYDAGRTEDNDP